MNNENRGRGRVNDIMEGIRSGSVVNVKILKKPFVDVDGTFIQRMILFTLGDGMEIEFCLWSREGMTFWDVSTDKEAFNSSGQGDYEEYLRGAGVLTEDIEDDWGDKWKYIGKIEHSGVYRVQYVME